MLKKRDSKKRCLSTLFLRDEWKIFEELLESWRSLIFRKLVIRSTSSEDIASIQGQIKTIAVLKLFQKKYSKNNLPNNSSFSLTEDDFITTFKL